MSVPPADLGRLSEFDAPEVVAPAFRRFRWRLVAVLVLVAGVAAFAGYSVDKTRSADLKELLHRGDALHTQPPGDNPLPYFSFHIDMAAAAGVESCSAFAIRMTQRFLPGGWHFNEEDVAAVRRGDGIAALRLEVGRDVPVRWHC